MLERIREWLGYRSPDDIVDFAMTGIAVVPVVAFFGVSVESAVVVLFLCMLPMLLVFLWAHAENEARQAREAARKALCRRISGEDD